MKNQIRRVSKVVFAFAAGIALAMAAIVGISKSIPEAKAECPCQTSAVSSDKGSIPQQSQAEVQKKKAQQPSGVSAEK